MMKPRHSQNGFTLVEMLLALAISGIVVAALASVLFGSFKVLRVLDDRDEAVLESTLIGLEKAVRELQSSPVCASIPFTGRSDSASFPLLIESENSLESALGAQFELGKVQTASVGKKYRFQKVEYYFDASKKALMRKTADEEPKAILESVRSVSFDYFVTPLERTQWSWVSTTPAKESAYRISAMRIAVSWDREKADYSIDKFSKTFILLRRHPLAVMEAA